MLNPKKVTGPHTYGYRRGFSSEEIAMIWEHKEDLIELDSEMEKLRMGKRDKRAKAVPGEERGSRGIGEGEGRLECRRGVCYEVYKAHEGAKVSTIEVKQFIHLL